MSRGVRQGIGWALLGVLVYALAMAFVSGSQGAAESAWRLLALGGIVAAVVGAGMTIWHLIRD